MFTWWLGGVMVMALDLGSTGLTSYRHAFRQQPWRSRSQNASDTMCYNERTLTRDKIEYLITGGVKNNTQITPQIRPCKFSWTT